MKDEGVDLNANTYVRGGSGTLQVDRHPDAPITRKPDRIPKDALGHALPNGKPCVCSTPTILRHSELTHCVTCGGDPSTPKPARPIPGAEITQAQIDQLAHEIAKSLVQKLIVEWAAQDGNARTAPPGERP